MNYKSAFTGLENYGHLNGSGIGVAVLDTGVNQQHPDLQHHFNDSPFTSLDFTRSNIGSEDKRGHGSHITGLIAGTQHNDEGIGGIAPNSNIWNIKVLADGSGSASNSALESAVEQLISEESCRIINMSFNLDFDQQEFVNPLMDRLFEANKIVVAAAGDNSTLRHYSGYPAFLENVVAVGAIDPDFRLEEGQQFAPGIDFVLPNENLLSCGPSNTPYIEKHGSSMATGLISGVIALMLQSNPNLDVAEIKAELAAISISYQNDESRSFLQIIKP